MITCRVWISIKNSLFTLLADFQKNNQMNKSRKSNTAAFYRLTLITILTSISILSTEAELFKRAAHANQTLEELVINGDFETSTMESGNLVPAGAGIWDGDVFSTPGAVGNISPLGGNQMLQFEGVGFDRSNPGSCCFSDVAQFLDLSAFSTEIATGTTFVSAEAFFNAIEPRSNNTYDFLLSLRAFSGEIPDSIPSATPLAEANSTLSADNDPATWEESGFNLDLPSETTHLQLLLSAFETDEAGDEQAQPGGLFPGSFADNVSATLKFSDTDTSVPEPSITLALLACGLYGLSTAGNKRRSLTKPQ